MGKASRRKKEPRTVRGVENLRTIPVPQGVPIKALTNLPEEQKVSTRLASLLETLLPEGIGSYPQEKCRTLLDYVVLAWNVSIFDKAVQDHEMNKMVKIQFADSVARQGFKDFLEEIIAIKIALYPDDKRFIASWNINFHQNKFSIVAAALDRPRQTVI